jgi:hypothetical protein
MATYKVIQDIEAEDHILGPLSLRQFIYALIAVFFFYLCFICLTKGVSFLLVLFLPPGLFCAFFAFPFGKDQPTEVWALAKIRFLFKPRRRIWNQSGVKELVTITVPKKIEVQRTDGLSQNEVKSRLRALADTLDSRGWVVKNLSSNVYAPSMVGNQGTSERLLSITSIPQPVPDYDIPSNADVLDERMSPLAQQFDSMITTAAQNRRQQLIDELTAPTPPIAPAAQPQDQWFNPTAPTTTPIQAPVQSVTKNEEAEAAARIKASLAAQAQVNAKLHTIPANNDNSDTIELTHEPAAAVAPPQPPTPPAPVTAQPDPVILNLAKNNDLNIATLAREAGKNKGAGDDEVVISLH